MPFPWKKKNRVTRISQIVADLQSPKRGGSLVVETGFPTSLIDLFVKNRTRFRKTRSNKPPPTDPSPPPPPPPSPATTPPPMTETPRPAPLIEGKTVPDRVSECGSGSGSGATVVVIKVLMVAAVLAASVERLTVGITVSAFALLLLEYAGKRVVSCIRPCSTMESLLRRVSSHLGFRKVLIEVIEPAATELNQLISNVDEIEVVEAESEIGNAIDRELDSSMVAEPLGSDQCKVRGSRSGRFKSKLVKKLVPKKFRGGSKKEKNNKQNEAESGSEVSSVVGEEEKLASFEIEEVGEEDVRREEGGGSKRLSFLVDDNGITCSQESSEEKRIGNNSGYTILVLITLVGLLVGRFPALILTMTWCLLLKIVKVFCR